MRDFSLDRLDRLFSSRKHHSYTLWRHDVDFSLDAALKMAVFEAERGISATYFLFLGHFWPFYSTEDAIEVEHLLFDLGHRIGQHIDERVQPDFADFIRGPVSFHCPTQNVLWRNFPGFYNAYASYWKDHYYSDSRGMFSFGDPEDDSLKTLQINLHSEWWFEPDWLDKIKDEEHERYWYAPKTTKTNS